MLITLKPDKLILVDKVVAKDDSDHLHTLIYAFKSQDNNQRYIVRAEYHREDVFGIKFYAKNHEQSEKKYQLVTNYKHPIRVFITCAIVLPILKSEFETASFGFIGARSIIKDAIIEDKRENVRFKIYTKHIPQLVGDDLFEHFEYPKISSYLVVNRTCGDIKKRKKAIEDVFFKNYPQIHQLT